MKKKKVRERGEERGKKRKKEKGEVRREREKIMGESQRLKM